MSRRNFAAEACRRAVLFHNLTCDRFISLTLLAIGLAFVNLTTQAQTTNGPTRLLRTPTVSASQIAFAYANNIWTVARSGGSAHRVTSFQGQTLNPHFSPDGKWIAFSAEYAGNLDAYVVAAEGGEPRRLTWGKRPN